MSVKSLAEAVGRKWPAFESAALAADEKLRELKAIVQAENIDSPDISLVVFGSLARGEWTTGSDLDWTMLIDGQAEHEHGNTSHRWADLITKAGFVKPGTTGTFGALTFSHDLIHQIGGMDDSNRNTTQRLLLLLESKAVNRGDAYDRVVRAILRRYLENDYRNFRLKVPRFLLNDLHRYWRTICVDYASKYREQAGQKWGIRNVKLRMSRKLIFAAGLLTCYQCDPDWIREADPQLFREPTADGLVNYLEGFVRQTPLDILAKAVATLRPETSDRIFGSYNTYLDKLSDPKVRDRLTNLKPDESKADLTFREMMELSDAFEDGLESLFCDNARLSPLTRKYGVF